MFNLVKSLSFINDALYTYVLIILLLGCGLYLSFKTRLVQFRFFLESFRLLTKKNDTKGVSSFQAMMIATASRVGVGNIVGVSSALIIGGPGALLWMWITAILGASSACVECILAQIYKVRNEDGTFRGGPAYYIQKISGKRELGVLFSILLILCFSLGFNGLQAFNFSLSFEYYIPNYSGSFWPYVVGGLLSFVFLLTILKGAKSVGIISSILVPIMSMIYIGVAFYIMIINIKKIPEILRIVISNALDFKSIFGGFFSSALLLGVKRGLFSNEAGMGSAPNAAATADVKHPAEQGILQIFSVLIDTLVCTSTIFLILASGIYVSSNENALYVIQKALSSQLGNIFGINFISISIILFSFSSIIGNYYYAESNILYICNSRIVLNIFRIICMIPIFMGAVMSSELAWNIADICMGLMAVMNIIFILRGSHQSINCLNDYSALRKQNKNIKFISENYGIENTLWK